MCLGQPDVQREQTGLGSEAEDHQPGSHRYGGGGRLSAQGGTEAVEAQRAQLMPQHEQTHQRGQTAQHSHSQVGTGGTHGTGGFFMGYPHIAGQGHDFEEDEGGVQIIGQEYAQGCTQGHQVEEVVAVAVMIVGKVLLGENARHHPHEGSNQRIQAAEAVYAQVKP